MMEWSSNSFPKKKKEDHKAVSIAFSACRSLHVSFLSTKKQHGTKNTFFAHVLYPKQIRNSTQLRVIEYSCVLLVVYQPQPSCQQLYSWCYNRFQDTDPQASQQLYPLHNHSVCFEKLQVFLYASSGHVRPSMPVLTLVFMFFRYCWNAIGSNSGRLGGRITT